ncbi:hypothetical protein HAX54_039655 [Datura stramonium]|uniref:Uncharacterized protein n=1 Tax=Datura stramonium TaxID=4076 RepID=A0ABS8SJ98_DATST|nr:hypothetical protein [Datura stramonium]
MSKALTLQVRQKPHRFVTTQIFTGSASVTEKSTSAYRDPATVTSHCKRDGEEEFLMESETSTKLLAAGGRQGSTNTGIPAIQKSEDMQRKDNPSNYIGAKLNGPSDPALMKIAANIRLEKLCMHDYCTVQVSSD